VVSNSRPFILLACLAALSGHLLQAQSLVVKNNDLALPVMYEDATITNSFIVSNTTGEAVEIVSVRPTCGCTFARAETNIVQPHALGKIIFGYRAGRSPGTISKKILLSTPSEQVYLGFTANVRSFFALDRISVELGAIDRTNTKLVTAEVLVTADSACSNLAAESFNYNSANLRVDWSREKSGNALRLRIEIDTARYTDAALRDGFSFTVLCSGGSRQFYVPVTGTFK
jgi:hypothetical protein